MIITSVELDKLKHEINTSYRRHERILQELIEKVDKLEAAKATPKRGRPKKTDEPSTVL